MFVYGTSELYSILTNGMIIGQAIFWGLATSFVAIYAKRGICGLRNRH